MALDAKIRIKEARKLRFSKYDAKRKNLVEELEERERAFKKSRLEKEEKQKNLWRENERIMEEGRLMREQREKDLHKREEEAAKAAETLADATRLRCLNLAYSIKGNLDGPLFRPWSATSNFEPWRLEEIDLSGWKVWHLQSFPYNLANEV